MTTRLLPDEHTIYNAGIHWFVLVGTVIRQLALGLVPMLAYIFVVRNFNIRVPLSTENLLTLIWVLWLIVIWISFFYQWTDFYLDRWLITNKRIVDSEQRGMFNREVASISYSHIQDIVVETKGFWATVFDIGDIHIQTAGSEKEVTFHRMGNPTKVRDLIISMMENKQ